MRALAVDYGTARIGLAMSDELGMFASPHSVLKASEESPAEIARIAAAEKVGAVIVGMPYRLDGSESDTTRLVKEFIAKLKPLLACPLVEWDEAFSTRIATRQMIGAGVKKKRRQTKGTSDMWAAAIILQEYLDSL